MILVTGATGHVGGTLVRLLVAANVQVRALVRDPSRATALHALGVTLVQGDLAAPDTLDAALQGAQKAFLLSAASDRLAELHANFIAAAQNAGLIHLVRSSALGAATASPVSLLRWHREAEQMLEQSGVPYTHLRPNALMQATLRFAPSIASEGRFYQSRKNSGVSVVDARDVAVVAAAVLTGVGHDAQTYDITGPEALTNDDIAARIAAAAGRPVAYADLPPGAYEQRLLRAGLPAWQVRSLVELEVYYSQGSAARVTDTIRQLAQQEPRTFDAFAHEFAHEFASTCTSP
jgi:uncharacterized protein YbjT (DUF2867 family)